MAKARRRKRRAKAKGGKLKVVALGLLLLLIALAVLYSRAPDDQKERIQEALSRGIDEISEKVNRRPKSDPIDPGYSGTADRFYAFAGIPQPTSYPYPIMVLTNSAYLAGYCDERKNPVWVSYRVFNVTQSDNYPRPSRFSIDLRTGSRIDHDDFMHSGFDRGHLAPDYAISTRYGREAQLETYLMSNIVPQRPALNRGVWKSLEQEIANEYAIEFEEIWVIAGLVFEESRTYLSSGVEIPDAFFKIVIDEEGRKPRALAFLIPADVEAGAEAMTFLCSVDQLEEATGLDFLWELPDPIESSLEAFIPGGGW